MTAEVGILNANGVVLAADSALTMGNSEQMKIFNSGNKIFSLGPSHSVAMMMFGNVQFMGIPWEIIVTGFHQKIGARPLDSVWDYCTEFFNYLESVDEIYSSIYTEVLIIGYAENVCNILENTTYIPSPGTFTLADYQKAVEDKIPALLKESEKMKSITKKAPIKVFADRYGEKLDEVFKELFDTVFLGLNLYDKFKSDLYKLVRNYVYSDSYYPDTYSGLVIAGFDFDELFPSIYQYDISGVVDRVIKKRLTVRQIVLNDFAEDRCSSAIVPFAQQDMVHTVINGIAPDLEADLGELLRATLEKLISELTEKKLLNESDAPEINKLKATLIESGLNAFDNMKQERHLTPVLMTIDSMPKDELALIAETLVNITSFKGKISFAMETVGGPIDVLLITKGDGPVWVKRKNYFNPDINRLRW